MVQESPVYHRIPPQSSQNLSELLKSGSHLLTRGDDGIAQTALGVSKDLFELGLALEQHSHLHLHPFLKSILEPPAFTTRASAKKAAAKAAAAPAPETLLPYTPLGELTVEGMEPEQVWAQLEMRNEGIGKVVREVGAGEAPEDGLEMEEDEDEDSDEESDSDEEMSVEEFRRMMMENGIDDEDSEGSGGDSEDDEVDFGDDIGMGSDEEEDSDEEDDEEGEDEEDDDDEDDSDEDEESELEDVAEDEGLSLDEDEELEEDQDDASALFGEAGPSRRPRHPTLDDQFFSIDEFNRLTEEAEAGRISGGRLGGEDEEDDEELGDIGDLMLRGAGAEDEIMYGDFFDRPRPSTAVRGSSGSSSSKKQKKEAKRAKRKGKAVSFGEDGDEEEQPLEDDVDEGEYSRMGRVKGDLFDNDEEDEQEPQNLSTHEKRQLELQKEIAQLESEAIGPKDWQLLGEATSKARPENSLLEEHLDFEHAGKIVPVVTEELVQTLEELIKRRIIDNNFDSPIRVRAYEPTPFLPSRYFELQDTQSAKSLAQIYEEEYQAAATGGKVVDARDEKLSKEHEEIEKIWGEICYKLDALSSLNFVPKQVRLLVLHSARTESQPKASITAISNLPTASMESALPPTAAANTMLAPEELLEPPRAASLVARSELTPEDAQKARGKARKAKAANSKRLAEAVQLYSKKKGAKAEKEEALKGLVKSGKGVTVVGKSDKEKGKAAKRTAEEGTRDDSKRFKL